VPRKVFVAGAILTAADVNTNLMDQAVMVFADSAARTAALASPSEGMVTYLADTDSLELYTTVWGPVRSGFTASVTITASDATWTVPSLGSPVVKVTVIGGGGGGGNPNNATGGTGGTTTFNAAGAGTATATGGVGGLNGVGDLTGTAGSPGNASANFGMGGSWGNGVSSPEGLGGGINVSYRDLTGITSVNVTIGAGGTGATGGDAAGGAGGRGEVIVEYVAGA